MRQANNFSVIERLHHLNILEEALERKLNKIKYLEERNATNFKLCKIGIIVQKSVGDSVFDNVYEYVATNTDCKYRKENRTGHKYFNQVEGALSDERKTTVDTGNTETMEQIDEMCSDQEQSDIYWRINYKLKV